MKASYSLKYLQFYFYGTPGGHGEDTMEEFHFTKFK